MKMIREEIINKDKEYYFKLKAFVKEMDDLIEEIKTSPNELKIPDEMIFINCEMDKEIRLKYYIPLREEINNHCQDLSKKIWGDNTLGVIKNEDEEILYNGLV